MNPAESSESRALRDAGSAAEALNARRGTAAGTPLDAQPDDRPNPYGRPTVPVDRELAKRLLALVEEQGSSLSHACRILNEQQQGDAIGGDPLQLLADRLELDPEKLHDALTNLDLRLEAPPAKLPGSTRTLTPGLILRDWMHDAQFAAEYAIARRVGYEVMAEQVIEIADDGRNDWVERETQSGRTILVPDHEHMARSRLRVDTRKWLLSKYLPKVYGEKLEVQHQVAFLISPEWILLRGVIVAALQAFPDALAAVLDALGRPLERQLPPRPRLIAGEPEPPVEKAEPDA